MGRRQPTKDPGNPAWGISGLLFGLIAPKQHTKGVGNSEREVDADRGGPGLLSNPGTSDGANRKNCQSQSPGNRLGSLVLRALRGLEESYR